MITDTIKQLSLTGKEDEANYFAERSIQLVHWLFTSGFKTHDGVSKYFDLLVTYGLNDIGIEKIEPQTVANYRNPILEKLLAIQNYQIGEYDKFIEEVDGTDFELSQVINSVSFNPDFKRQDQSGRLIFGHSSAYGEGKVLPWFNIILANAINSNVSAVIDVMYMGNFTPIIKDTLNLSISLQEIDGILTPMIHQASWENGNELLVENLRYDFTGNVFTVYAGYVEQYTGYQYNVRLISTREGGIHHSLVASNKGYKENILFDEISEFEKFNIE